MRVRTEQLAAVFDQQAAAERNSVPSCYQTAWPLLATLPEVAAADAALNAVLGVACSLSGILVGPIGLESGTDGS